MPWEQLPVPVDEGTIIREILTGLSEKIPGWVPSEGAPEVALAEEVGYQLAVVNRAAVAAIDHAAAGIAAAFGFEPVDGIKAVLPQVTLTAQLPPSAGTAPFDRAVTVPAGFTVTVGQQPFLVPEQITLVASFTEVTSGDFTGYWRGDISVDFLALDVGDEWNTGELGEKATIQTVSPIIVTATLTAPATGGVGAETLPAFLTRFTAWLATLKPGGVRAEDLARFAATVEGTQRALALDRYDPNDPGTPADRTVTIIPVTATGADLDSFARDRLLAELEGIREVGFVFNLIDPNRTAVAVDVTVTVATGHEATAVQAAVDAAITDALSPAVWGTADGDPATWVEADTLRTLDVAVVVATVPGVASIDGITLDGGAADIALTTPGALIDASITVTAS
ncbi:baseplate J/gp47 family protein [Microbacterium karelineae]|uniref:baseplate J/gp47 family protein n=1 Tax=Microbacterium karelineae TaxID=2654283 RepID=UPI0012EA2BE9|nr:baseplate J/gp47 family protein [Microbacterium karelineae]